MRLIHIFKAVFPEDYHRILEAGFDRVIVKPVNIQALIDTIL